MHAYQGHRSWNAWNVSLWLNNDYSLYSSIMDTFRAIKQESGSHERALRLTIRDFMRNHARHRTPDGARYTRLAVTLAITDMVEEG